MNLFTAISNPKQAMREFYNDAKASGTWTKVGAVIGAILGVGMSLGSPLVVPVAAIAGVYFGAKAGKEIDFGIATEKAIEEAGLVFPKVIINRGEDETVGDEKRIILNLEHVVIFEKEEIAELVELQVKEIITVDEQTDDNTAVKKAEDTKRKIKPRRKQFKIKFSLKEDITFGEFDYLDLSKIPNIDIIITAEDGVVLKNDDPNREKILNTLQTMPKLLGKRFIDPEAIIKEKLKVSKSAKSFVSKLFSGGMYEIETDVTAAPSKELKTGKFLDGLINTAIRTGDYDILKRHNRVLSEQYKRHSAVSKGIKIKEDEVAEKMFGKVSAYSPVFYGALATLGIILVATALTGTIAAVFGLAALGAAGYTFYKGWTAFTKNRIEKREVRADELKRKRLNDESEKYKNLDEVAKAITLGNNITLRDIQISDVCMKIITKKICGAEHDNGKLELINSKITAADATKLAEALEKGTKIVKIDLSGNPIGDDGIEVIVKSLHENFTIVELSYDKLSGRKSQKKSNEIDLGLKKQLAINKYLQGQSITQAEEELFQNKTDESIEVAAVNKIKKAKHPVCLLALAEDKLPSGPAKVALAMKQKEFIALIATDDRDPKTALRLVLAVYKQNTELLDKAALKETLSFNFSHEPELKKTQLLNLSNKATVKKTQLLDVFLGKSVIKTAQLLKWLGSAIKSNDKDKISTDDIKILLDFCFASEVKAALVLKIMNSDEAILKEKQQFLDAILINATNDKDKEIFLKLAITDICDNKCAFLKTLDASELSLCFDNHPNKQNIVELILELTKKVDGGLEVSTKITLVREVLNSDKLMSQVKKSFLEAALMTTNNERDKEIFLKLVISDIRDNQSGFLKALEKPQINELLILCLKDDPNAHGIATLISELIKVEGGQEIVKQFIVNSNNDACLLSFDKCIEILQKGKKPSKINEIIQVAIQEDLKNRFVCLKCLEGGSKEDDFKELAKEVRQRAHRYKLLTGFDFPDGVDPEVKKVVQYQVYLNNLRLIIDQKGNFSDLRAVYERAEYKEEVIKALNDVFYANTMKGILGGEKELVEHLRFLAKDTEKPLRIAIIEQCIGPKNAYSVAVILSELIDKRDTKIDNIIDKFVLKMINTADIDIIKLIESIKELRLPPGYEEFKDKILNDAIGRKLTAGVCSAENALNYAQQQLSNNFDLTKFSHKLNDKALDGYIDFICQRNEAYKCVIENRLGDFAKLYNKLAKQAGDNENYKEALLEIGSPKKFLEFIEKAIKPWEKGEGFVDLGALDEAGRIMILENYLIKNCKKMLSSCLHDAAALLNSLLPRYGLLMMQQPKAKVTSAIRGIITKLIKDTKNPDDIKAIRKEILGVVEIHSKELSDKHKEAFLKISGVDGDDDKPVPAPGALLHKTKSD